MGPLLVLFVAIMAGSGFTAGVSRPREYCKWETFNATCRRPDHVIVMRSARYGRMRFGRCMQEDHGSVGCSTDVLPVLDRKCSGRHTCEMLIPDASLHAVQMCPRELIPYLEASYDCVQVRVANKHTCAMFGGVPLRSRAGYLAAISAVESPVGTIECPWVVDLERGQRLNLSVLGSGTWTTATTHYSDESSPGGDTFGCLLRLIIRDDNKTVTFPVCSQLNGQHNTHTTSAERTQHDHRDVRSQQRGVVRYESEGRRIRVFMQLQQASTDDNELSLAEYLDVMGAFVIKYEVYGCADITWLSNAVVRRHGDQTVITCNGTGETYYVTCDDNRWPLDFVNCTKSSVDRLSLRVNRSLILPRSVVSVVAVGILIGACVGVAVLAIVLRCIRSSTRVSSGTSDEVGCSCRGRTKEPLLYPYGSSAPPTLHASFELDGLSYRTDAASPLHCSQHISHSGRIYPSMVSGSCSNSTENIRFTTTDEHLTQIYDFTVDQSSSGAGELHTSSLTSTKIHRPSGTLITTSNKQSHIPISNR